MGTAKTVTMSIMLSVLISNGLCNTSELFILPNICFFKKIFQQKRFCMWP